MEHVKKPLEPFRVEIINILSAELEKIGGKKIEVSLQVPSEKYGDFSYPCFEISKLLKIPAEEIANKVARNIGKKIKDAKFIEKVDPIGGYLNIQIQKPTLVEITLKSVLNLKENYGRLDKKNKKVIVEHTSANPTGPLHIGRARNSIIGDSLARVLRFAGYDVTTEYYVNDVGKQSVLLSWGVKNLKLDEKNMKKDYALVEYYKEAYRKISENPNLNSEIENMVLRFENGDAEVANLVRDCSKKILEGIEQSLSELNIKIDNYVWESKLLESNAVWDVVEKLKKSDKVCIEDGAYFLKIDNEKVFLTRKDGTTLYTTRDIAYHIDKFKRSDFVINILGEDQKLAMQTLEEGLLAVGYEKKPENVFYSFVSLPDGRMSTRDGKVVYLDDIISEGCKRAYEEVYSRRGKELSEEKMKKIAKAVGVGAIRFNIVKVQSEKAIVFTWKDALNFEGASAPFIQYAHARCNSILKKYISEGGKIGDIYKFVNTLGTPNGRSGNIAKILNTPFEIKLIRKIAEFPEIIELCAEERRVNTLANYSLELAEVFNLFYKECPVLHPEMHPELPAEDKKYIREGRLALVLGCKITLSNALACLGIEAPEEM